MPTTKEYGVNDEHWFVNWEEQTASHGNRSTLEEEMYPSSKENFILFVEDPLWAGHSDVRRYWSGNTDLHSGDRFGIHPCIKSWSA
jgi:hypothetical protein